MRLRPLPALLIAALLVLLFVFSPAIPQDPSYHDFADQRGFAGIPNFLNVLSNLPFLLVGLPGLWLAQAARHPQTAALREAWLLFFVGILLTTFGSGWYHWSPSNLTLVFDRLPMTIGFMSLFAIVLAEYTGVRVGRALLWSFVTVGFASVIYWIGTEALGRGDLRPYALVQFLPMLVIPVLLLRFGERSDLTPWLWLTIGCYFAAKLLEHFDAEVLAMGDIVSGHSLKHVAAAFAPAMLWLALRQRERSTFSTG